MGSSRALDFSVTNEVAKPIRASVLSLLLYDIVEPARERVND